MLERRGRVVLAGGDTARLLEVAGELEARGLPVALYSGLERGLEECAGDRCDALVAIGRLALGEDEAAQRVAVPLVLLDAPDAPNLPLRPTGRCTALSAGVTPAAVAARVVALLPPGVAAGLAARPSRSGRVKRAPAMPPAAALSAAPPAADSPPATVPLAASPAPVARPPAVAPAPFQQLALFRMLLVAVGLAVGFALGRLFLAWSWLW